MALGTATRHSVLIRKETNERHFERVLRTTSQLVIVFLGVVAGVVVLMAGQVVLAPVFLAIIIGLMFGPVADRLEHRGISSGISAAIVVLMFIALLLGGMVLFAVPLSEWVGRAPAIWAKIQAEMVNWQAPLEAIGAMQEQLKSVLGSSDTVEVTVADGNQVLNLALIAPSILAEVLVFLLSLYFYLATRDNIRIAVLSICVTRRMRWRTAHVFNEVESKVSRFLLAVTGLNVVVGVAVTLETWALGLPSPLLWGALAAVLNYIPYLGQAVMLVILLAVGISTQNGLLWILAPALVYAAINFIEGQVLFPALIGKAVTLNPFLIFLSISFWIWAWGPIGSLVAVPSLLILQSLVINVLPMREVNPIRPVRRTANMTEKDVVLQNAAQAIKEKAEAEAAAKESADQRLVTAKEAVTDAKATVEEARAGVVMAEAEVAMANSDPQVDPGVASANQTFEAADTDLTGKRLPRRHPPKPLPT